MSATVKLAIGSVFIGIAVFLLKIGAWWVTGSVALYSDALESVVNVVTAIAAFVAISYAARPADANHPYGHHKAEYFSAVLEGVMIIIAALLILAKAYESFQNPRPIDAPFEGIVLNAIATMINAFWAWVLIRRGRALKSPALRADGHHLFTDVLSSVGVAVGVLLVVLTGWQILDPIIAAVVAVNILWSGWKVFTSSLSGLMDEAVPDDTLQEIRDAISGNADGALEAHDLRTRQAGAMTYIDFHLVVDGQTTVSDAHDICDRLEAKLKDIVPQSQITIHVEPEEKAKHSGVLVV